MGIWRLGEVGGTEKAKSSGLKDKFGKKKRKKNGLIMIKIGDKMVF